MNLLKDLISEMTLEETDRVLALLHKRVCEDIAKENCKECPWRWSILCKYVYEYLKRKEDQNAEER